MRGPRIFGLALAAVLVAPGCQFSGLAFVEDQRVAIVTPDYREAVALPVTVDWEVTDDALADELGTTAFFGVLLDKDPQPPGESFDYFARDDRVCDNTEGCPDEKYLSDLGVHATDVTEMSFDFFAPAPGVDLEEGDRDTHEVTLILLDADGVRVGESAWTIIFEIERGDD